MKYLYSSNQLLTNPAEDMELPRLPHRLPMGILSGEEIQRIFALPDLDPEQTFSHPLEKGRVSDPRDRGASACNRHSPRRTVRSENG
jgi:hypothetical protein